VRCDLPVFRPGRSRQIRTLKTLKGSSTCNRKRKSRNVGPQARREGVLSQIEDATYAILRKHEKQSA